MSDPYRVLRLPTTATHEEIDNAYRKMVRRYPPELNPGRFAEIHRAYKTLVALDRAMEEALERPIEALESLYPPPVVRLRPADEEPPTRPGPDDLEPLIHDLRRHVLRQILRSEW